MRTTAARFESTTICSQAHRIRLAVYLSRSARPTAKVSLISAAALRIPRLNPVMVTIGGSTCMIQELRASPNLMQRTMEMLGHLHGAWIRFAVNLCPTALTHVMLAQLACTAASNLLRVTSSLDTLTMPQVSEAAVTHEAEFNGTCAMRTHTGPLFAGLQVC